MFKNMHNILNITKSESQDSSMVQHWATGWIICGLRTGRGWKFFSSPLHPDQL
jgi:hypothetical protein